MLTGPGLEVHLASHLTPEIALARLARHRLEMGQTANPAQLVPTYLRPAL